MAERDFPDFTNDVRIFVRKLTKRGGREDPDGQSVSPAEARRLFFLAWFQGLPRQFAFGRWQHGPLLLITQVIDDYVSRKWRQRDYMALGKWVTGLESLPVFGFQV